MCLQSVYSCRHCQGVELGGFLQVIRCKVGVTHGHGDRLMTEYLLQHQDVAPVHHKVARERVTEYVG